MLGSNFALATIRIAVAPVVYSQGKYQLHVGAYVAFFFQKLLLQFFTKPTTSIYIN